MPVFTSITQVIIIVIFIVITLTIPMSTLTMIKNARKHVREPPMLHAGKGHRHASLYFYLAGNCIVITIVITLTIPMSTITMIKDARKHVRETPLLHAGQ